MNTKFKVIIIGFFLSFNFGVFVRGSEIDLHKLCLDARDYSGCLEANKSIPPSNQSIPNKNKTNFYSFQTLKKSQFTDCEENQIQRLCSLPPLKRNALLFAPIDESRINFDTNLVHALKKGKSWFWNIEQQAVNCRTSQLQTRKLSSSADEIELNNWKTLTDISNREILKRCPEKVGYKVVNEYFEMNFNNIEKKGNINIFPIFDKKDRKFAEAHLNCQEKTYAIKQNGKLSKLNPIDPEHSFYVRVCKID